MLKNVPTSLSEPVMNIKLALKLLILGGYNNVIGGMGQQYFFTQQSMDAL